MSKRDCSFNILFDAKIENLPYNSNAKKLSFLDNSFKEWKTRFQGFFGFWNMGGIRIYCIEDENINFNGQNNDNAKNQNYHHISSGQKWHILEVLFKEWKCRFHTILAI